ncbi:hypothetical protein ABKV47_21730 [Enterobacter hormaechei]
MNKEDESGIDFLLSSTLSNIGLEGINDIVKENSNRFRENQKR